jgi:hypothetical protein
MLTALACVVGEANLRKGPTVSYLLLLAPMLLCGAAPPPATPAPPALTTLRFDEDWSRFDPDTSDAALGALKHVPLGDSAWASFGGSTRLRYEYFDGFGFSGLNHDDYLLYRAFVHADLHLNEHVRLFLQARFSDITDRGLPGAKREDLDFDRGDLWNTFVQFDFSVGGPHATLRLGRQELLFGKERVISPLDWSNNRRIFDGAVFLHMQGEEKNWALDVFATRPVRIDGTELSWNSSDDNRAFGGAYYTQKLGAKRAYTAEAYLLYQQRDANALTREDLYTLGGRVIGPISSGLSFDFEGAGQFGKRRVSGQFFDDSLDIAAWFVTAEATYKISKLPWQPFVTLGFDYASGDDDPTDGEAGGYSQLYPLGHAYFGFIDTIARQNIIDTRVSLGAWPIDKKLKLQADFHLFWRASETDALYNAGGGPVRGASFVTPGGRTVISDARDIGEELDVTLLYKPHRNVTWLTGYSHFFTGSFLRDTGNHSDIDFIYSQLEFSF